VGTLFLVVGEIDEFFDRRKSPLISSSWRGIAGLLTAFLGNGGRVGRGSLDGGGLGLVFLFGLLPKS
jgi:hypothetical protein